MELDSGSAISCISTDLFNSLFSGLQLVSSSRALCIANGKLVSNVRVCSVSIKFRGAMFSGVQLYVVDGFPSLFGRNWIRLVWGHDWLDKVISQPVIQDNFRTGEVRQVTADRSRCSTECVERVSAVSYESSERASLKEQLDDLKKSPVFSSGLGEVND